MRPSMFRYKLFRQKFLFAFVVAVVCLCVIFGGVYLTMTARWVNTMESKASELFLSAELKIQDAQSLVDAQLERVYSNTELLRDLHALLGSASESDYIKARAENSRISREQIRSFPEEVRSYVYRHGPGLQRVDLYSEENVNSFSFLSSATIYRYLDKQNAEALPMDDIRQGFTIRRTLRDPSNFYRELVNGEVAFTFNSGELFPQKGFEDFRFAAVADGEGHILYLKGSEADWTLLNQLLKTQFDPGVIWESPLNRLFFHTGESTSNGYRLIVCVDDRSIRRENAGLLLFMAFLFAGIGSVLMFLYGCNLRYDALFLAHILDTVKGVREGDFRETGKPSRYRKNEYGMIAREIDEMSDRLNHHILASYELRLKQQETEMRALQNQINPHFLYNTLESIRAMALLNQDEKTSDAVANLGALYRDIVKQQDTITIGDELTLLQKYLKIMELKHPDRFFYQFEVPIEIKLIKTVKFWMQPLAENFFKHGFDREGNFNLLIVSGSVRPEGFRIQIIDNGATLSAKQLAALNAAMSISGGEQETESIGMNNVSVRLRYFYGAGFQMRIENNEENGVRVIVDIPKLEEEDHVPVIDSRR